MQPTPGPWMVDPFRDASSDDGEMGYIPIVNGTMTIAEVWLVNSDEEETQANAQIMAASKDLLAALEETRDNLEQLQTAHLHKLGLVPAMEKINAAIAKAKGTL